MSQHNQSFSGFFSKYSQLPAVIICTVYHYHSKYLVLSLLNFFHFVLPIIMENLVWSKHLIFQEVK